MLLPFYCVRALAARSPKDAGEGFMAAGLFGFPWMLVVVTIGIIGGGTVTGVATDAIFLKTMEAYLPVGVLGLVLAGIFGIIMSSQDSCLHSGSVAFSIDIFQHFRPNTPPATLLRYSQFIVGVMTFFFFLPNILLSGFMFPFRGMPEWAQAIGQMLPLTHFLRIVRGITLKGIGFADMHTDVLALVLFMLAAMGLALFRFRRTLD